MYISKLLSKSCCPHLHKMHEALWRTSSLDAATLSNTTTSSTGQKPEQRQISLLASAAANQKSGSAEMVVVSVQANYFY